MPPKKKNPVGSLLEAENRDLRVQLRQKNNEIKNLTAEVTTLKSEIIKEKATSTELNIRYGQNPPNLDPKVDMVRLRLPQDLDNEGARLNEQPKKKNPVGSLLETENRDLRVKLRKKNSEIRNLTAKVQTLKRELIKAKATSIELKIRYGQNPPNLNPKVKMMSLKLPQDLQKEGVRLNLEPKVNVKRYRIPDRRDEKFGAEAQPETADDIPVESAGPSGHLAQKPSQKTKRQSSDGHSQQSKRKKQNQVAPEVQNDPDGRQDQLLQRDSLLDDDLYLSTSSSGASSQSETSPDSSLNSISSETDTSGESLLVSVGPSVSYETLKPAESSKRDLPKLQSEDNETEAVVTDTSLDSDQKLNAMVVFDSCYFCDGPLPCTCQK